jgi:hypothetical protein
MEDKFLESFAYSIPAIVTGLVAYYFFNSFLKQGNLEKKIALLAAKKKDSLPLKLHAYERMLLFCERINPVKMLLRIEPIGNDKNEYLQLILKNIEQEFQHNLVQQIYISDPCWHVIIASKNAVINKLRQVVETSNFANDLRENILLDYSKLVPPTDTAIIYIKEEVKKLL